METKTQLEKFVEGVDSLSNELIDESKGYILFAYEENGDNMQSAFTSKGRLNNIAECLYACMKQNPMLANVVIAASNGIVQSRMAQMQAEMPVTPEEAIKPKRKRKKNIS